MSETRKTTTRRSRRYAIAFACMADLAEVTRYQPTVRVKVPLYEGAGRGEHDMACAVNAHEPLPGGYEWQFVEECYGWKVYVA